MWSSLFNSDHGFLNDFVPVTISVLIYDDGGHYCSKSSIYSKLRFQGEICWYRHHDGGNNYLKIQNLLIAKQLQSINGQLLYTLTWR